MQNHYQCCPVCGHILTYRSIKCFICEYGISLNRKERKEIKELYGEENVAYHPVKLYTSQHPIEYYEKLSFQKYQTFTKAFDVFVEIELSKLPSFSRKKYKIALQKEAERLERAKYIKEHPEEFVPKSPPVPKCPTCQSTNIKKIGAFDRVTSVAFLGLASSKIGKQFQCNNCGYKW